MGDARFVHVETGVGHHVTGQCLELFGREEVQLEVLGTTAYRLDHLVGFGGSQYEHHVVGRFLEGLEERVLSTRGEHVYLVQQVHLGASRGSQSNLGQQFAHVVDLVVGRSIQLVEVERRSGVHGLTGGTRTARLASLGLGAVQRLGQDPCSRRLAGASGPAQ